MNRFVGTATAAVGALLAGISAQALQSPSASAAWAVLAGAAVGLMLTPVWARLVGGVLAALACAAAAWAFATGATLPGAGFCVAALGGAVLVVAKSGKRNAVARRTPRESTDMWRSMDDGYDPTL